MPFRKVIILGSSRKDGDTRLLVDRVQMLSGWDLIDLNEYDISYYDYEHRNAGDDYLPLMRRLVEQYEVMIFATPVYWYSMSGIMKVFFDRFTDLLEIDKDLGRRLRGKKMAAISCSIGNHLGDAFWLPFRETADYLGMTYLGGMHAVLNNGELTEEEVTRMEAFVRRIDDQSPQEVKE